MVYRGFTLEALQGLTPEEQIQSFWRSCLYACCTMLSGLLAGLLLQTIFAIHADYRAYLALGPGGTPQNLYGYLHAKVLGCFALRNVYSPPVNRLSTSGYLTSLPPRALPRPRTAGIAPHRQTTQRAPAHLHEVLTASLQRYAALNPLQIEVGTSCFETHSLALFARSPQQCTCNGEIAHAHPSDGSTHLVLHPGDVKVVLESGWGELHPLAKGGWWERFVPEGFVMVYAPTEGGEGEVEVVMEIVRAAARFVCRGEGKGEKGNVGEGEWKEGKEKIESVDSFDVPDEADR